jgi:hypothetical protein
MRCWRFSIARTWWIRYRPSDSSTVLISLWNPALHFVEKIKKPGLLASPHHIDDPAVQSSEVPLAVVGKALQPLNQGTGVTQVLVTPQ